jgi:integrase
MKEKQSLNIFQLDYFNQLVKNAKTKKQKLSLISLVIQGLTGARDNEVSKLSTKSVLDFIDGKVINITISKKKRIELRKISLKMLNKISNNYSKSVTQIKFTLRKIINDVVDKNQFYFFFTDTEMSNQTRDKNGTLNRIKSFTQVKNRFLKFVFGTTLIPIYNKDGFETGFQVIPNFSTHSLRVGFITLVYKLTNSIVHCQRLVNHSNIETTNRYIKLDLV